MIRTTTAVAAALLMAAPLTAQECRFEAQRDARLDAASGDRLVLIARSGSLRVEGRSGTGEITVRGRACASSEALLERLRLRSERSGGIARVEVEEIDSEDGVNWRDNTYARLDLVIEIPAGMQVDIEDGSGEMIVRGTGDLVIDDGSGEIDVADIDGSVRIEDGSGEVMVARVRGDVTIDDGSGEVTVSDITGSLTLDDGSGSIDIAGIDGSVRIPDDGSGDLDVRDVGGDLIVSDKGTGNIDHSDVRGRVDIPDLDRKRRRWRR